MYSYIIVYTQAHTATLQQSPSTEVVAPPLFTEIIGTNIEESSSSSGKVSELTTDTSSPSRSSVSPPLFSSLSHSKCDSESNFSPQAVHMKSTNEVPSFKIVGDNIDKYVKPREMRINAQAKSLNYFNSYAIKGRINVSELEDLPCCPDFRSFESEKLLPTKQDLEVIETNFVILIQRVLKKHFSFFKTFCSKVVKHIKHRYYKERAQKSEVVWESVCIQ